MKLFGRLAESEEQPTKALLLRVLRVEIGKKKQ